VLTTDPDPDTRLRAALALKEVPQQAAVEYLATALLEDDHAHTRKICAEALWAIGGAKAKEALLQARNDPDGKVRDLVEKHLQAFDGRDKHSTMLFKAIYESKYEEARSLLDKGADPNFIKQEEEGTDTPLIHAVQWHQGPIVDLLLSRGADVNIGNAHGMTAFHLVCLYGDLRLVNTFLKSGARVDMEHLDANPPLYFAIYAGSTDVVRCLLKAGADVHRATQEGTSVREWASANADDKINKLLQ
jgi:ankyrin repeat protein